MLVQSLSYKDNSWSERPRSELNSDTTLVLCFYDPQIDISGPLKELNKTFDKAIVVGCSTAGEIHDTMVSEKSLSAAIVKFEKSKIKMACAEIIDAKDSFSVGERIGKSLSATDLRYVLILSDGLNVNGTDLSEGITSVVSELSKNVTVSGGLSGDGSRFQRTSTVMGSDIKSMRVIAIGVYGGHLEVGTGSFGGWDAFGPKRKITKSAGNVLSTIDGEPALSLYKTYLGDQTAKLPASALLFPLAISNESRRNVVRTVLAVDEKTQTMTFAGDIPQDSTVQLMRANFTGLVTGAASAGTTAAKALSAAHHDSLAIAVSCVGRRLVMGERIEDETEALKEVLPENAKIVGFYSYGELSPSDQRPCDLHNQTMTVTLIQETA